MAIAKTGVKVSKGDDEKALNKVFAALIDRQDRIKNALDSLGGELPQAYGKMVSAQQKITLKSREPELKDLAKAAKKQELSTNPAKLKRLIDDIDTDVDKTNGLVDGHAKALDEVRVGKIKELRHDASVKMLKQGKMDSIINAAVKKASATAPDVLKELQDAYDKQIHPDKSRWASYLGLGAGGSYTISKAGSYGGYDIHLTMSNDSWTSDANGKVDVTEGNAAKVLENLLNNSSVGKQLHATLECGDSKEYPHVFLYGGVSDPKKKWEKAFSVAKAAKNLDDSAQKKWIQDGQAACQKALDDLKSKLESKLQAAQNNHASQF